MKNPDEVERDTLRLAMGIRNRIDIYIVNKAIKKIFARHSVSCLCSWKSQNPALMWKVCQDVLKRFEGVTPMWNLGMARKAVQFLLTDTRKTISRKAKDYITNPATYDRRTPRKPRYAPDFRDLEEDDLDEDEVDNEEDIGHESVSRRKADKSATRQNKTTTKSVMAPNSVPEQPTHTAGNQQGQIGATTGIIRKDPNGISNMVPRAGELNRTKNVDKRLTPTKENASNQAVLETEPQPISLSSNTNNGASNTKTTNIYPERPPSLPRGTKEPKPKKTQTANKKNNINRAPSKQMENIQTTINRQTTEVEVPVASQQVSTPEIHVATIKEEVNSKATASSTEKKSPSRMPPSPTATLRVEYLNSPEWNLLIASFVLVLCKEHTLKAFILVVKKNIGQKIPWETGYFLYCPIGSLSGNVGLDHWVLVEDTKCLIEMFKVEGCSRGVYLSFMSLVCFPSYR